MMASMSAASGEHHEGKANEVGWNSDADEAYSEEEERARRKMRERKKTKKRRNKQKAAFVSTSKLKSLGGGKWAMKYCAMGTSES